MGPVVDDNLIKLDGFSILRQDRNTNGGGVALYVRNDFKVKKLACSNTLGPGKPGIPEFIFCSVQHGNSPPILVGVIYRPPKIAMQKDTAFFNVLRDLCSEYSHKIIMGDLNADLSSSGTVADAKTVKRLARELSLQIIQHGPTHHKRKSHTWIDLILTDENDTILDYTNEWLPSFGKHAIIDVTIDIFCPELVSESFSYRNYQSICPSALSELLTSCDWVAMDSIEADLEGALNNLNLNLKLTIDKVAPLKTINPRKNYAPWIGSELKLLMDKRDATHRRYKRTGCAPLLREFLRLSNEVDERIDQERTTFLHKQLADALDEKKNIWKEMRKLGLLPKQKQEELHGFTPDELNAHFAGISISPLENLDNAMDIISTAPEEGFSFKPIDLNEVVLAISHFSSQAKGVDGVPQSVIVKALPIIGNFLVRIFNSSFAQGIFPGSWKQAQLIALKKSAAPSSESDFRPIALLCFLSKVLEKIAHTQITEYLHKNKILDPFQAGFRRHHSTQTALIKITDDIRIAIDKKKITLLLLFDFSKAFDTISPCKLLSKLRQLGFSRMALLWIKSYLQGRTQIVISKNHGTSDWLQTNLGVPQGSVLGPLLFSLYVNDLQDVLNGHTVKHMFYADDLQIYVHSTMNELQEDLSRLSEAARQVAEWAERSGLRLNTGKTKAIFFGSKRKVNDLNSMCLPGIEMQNGELIPFSNEVVSLGVTLDSKLTWRPHVDQISKKVNKALYSLRFIRACTTETLRRRLVETLVQPLLDYCSVVCLDATDEQRIRLQRLSNSCVRYIFGVRRDKHITPYRQRLGWLRTDSRRLYFASILMYKITRMREPGYLAAFFTKHNPRPASRGPPPELEVAFVTSETGARSFQVQCASFWNSLPSSLRNLPSLTAFKRAMRKHLLDLDS